VRDVSLRRLYLDTALADVPRLLGAIDRNPLRPTYGCLDREFWHYRTASFPSGMHQEGVLALALIYSTPAPGNRWYGEPRLRQWAAAGVAFAARSSHADGSCDDYYPFERALGAAVFSLQAAARTCRILGLCEPQLLDWLQRRADWVLKHDESGRLSNHHALAALGLWHVGQLPGLERFREAARQKLLDLLASQHEEGWFEEYGGADPGYQTLTIDCLAKLRREMADLPEAGPLDEALHRAVGFARWFLHPDGSFAGPYGSRGTSHFFPHGMELLSPSDPNAADLADGHLAALARGRQAHFSDDRLYVHRTANLLEAYRDWSPDRPEPDWAWNQPQTRYFAGAKLLADHRCDTQTIISAARGGVFRQFRPSQPVVTDVGLIVRTAEGRLAVSSLHDCRRPVEMTLEGRTTGPQETASSATDSTGASASVSGVSMTIDADLHWVRFETATPVKQALLHLGMTTVGRFCRTLVRKLLQRRVITGRRRAPIRLTRRLELRPSAGETPVGTAPGPWLRVIDEIVLTDARTRVAALHFASDLEPVYVAASDVYQDSVLQPWTDLGDYVEPLNRDRRVTIVREF